MHTAFSLVYLESDGYRFTREERGQMSGAGWVWLVAAIIGLIAVFGVFEFLTVVLRDEKA